MELYTLKKKRSPLPNRVVAVKVLANSEGQARQLASEADDGSYLWLTDWVTVESRVTPGPIAIIGFNFLKEEPEAVELIPSVVDIARRCW